jgi:hypothetical protein
VPISSDGPPNRYVKGTAIAFAYAFGAGALLWCLGVVPPIIYICAGLTYFAFALQIVLATSSYGASRMLASIGTVLAFGLLLFGGLLGLFYEFAQHGIRGGFIFRWVG